MTTPKIHFPFDNSYARLPERFYTKQKPQPVSKPALIQLNRGLAAELGLDPGMLESEEGVHILAGNRLPENAEPLAMAYAGHQFGNFVPQLGDGRALLLGEIKTPDGERRDIQLKGSGRTPFSRGGDGRAWLGPVIREYIVSEAMHALGVPTTRALAAVATGESVLREAPLPGAIITRVASSHLRVGTFQYFAARQDTEALRILADYAIDRHYPEAREAENPYAAFLDAVSKAQARLVAKWLQLGFIHGVMNTDNMSISGETIDYGPCAFMDHYESSKVFSSIDRHGRYAYDQQAVIAQWNLARLAETLLPLIHEDEDKAIAIAEPIVKEFSEHSDAAWLKEMRAKLGLFSEESADTGLIHELLDIMERCEADYTLSFRALVSAAKNPPEAERADALLGGDGRWTAWKKKWDDRLARQRQSHIEAGDSMCQHNPALIPRNHLVERIIQTALDENDYSLMKEMTEALSRPYEDSRTHLSWTLPPRPEERVMETFCGT